MTQPNDPNIELDTDLVVRWLTEAAAEVDEAAGLLTDLDAAIGDADHGSNLQRGFSAVAAALKEEPPATPGKALTLAGMRLVSSVGGASGPLYGTLLRRSGKALGDAERVTGQQLADALRAGTDAVAKLGGAAPGDKTMLDALYPAVDALAGGSEGPGGPEVSAAGSYAAARDAAEEGARATVPLRARKGRASYLGDRSEGHQDPGATSSALLFAALAKVVSGDE